MQVLLGLVDARGLQIKCARVLHESVPVLCMLVRQ